MINAVLAVAAALTIPAMADWMNRDVPLGFFASTRGMMPAVIDTGGNTEFSEDHPRNFSSFYHGLPVKMAIGPDYLIDHVLTIGKPVGVPDNASLDVRSMSGLTAAFVSCDIGGSTSRMLLDTAALAWATSDGEHEAPLGAIFLAHAAFDRVRDRHPEWDLGMAYSVMDGHGQYVSARSLLAASTTCGGVRRERRIVVERTDESTYDLLARMFKFDVEGDASLSAFAGTAVRFDFPNQLLSTWRAATPAP